MKNIVIAAVAILTAYVLIASYEGNLSTHGIKSDYLQYLNKFGKNIPQGGQFQYRLKIFKDFVKQMQKHNSDSTKTWKMGINQFSDITEEQFVNTYLGEKQSHTPLIIQEEVNAGYNGEVDWRKAGIITAIKDQGKCGSCWAFAATAAHESYQVQVHGFPKSISLSQQQLVDCSTSYPYQNSGCNGGLGSRALEYIKDFGQTTTDLYPYIAKNQDCQTQTGRFHIFGVSEIAGCQQIEIVLQRRPMAVRVDASNWKSYSSGIFSDCDTKLNHAVFLIGSNLDYWTIKNSWSEAWGETGYIKLAKGNTCGVCTGPSFPI